MPISKQKFEELIFRQSENAVRFTQDSPVYPDVWKEYFENRHSPNYKADLILTPHKNSSAAELFLELSIKLFESGPISEKTDWQIASSGDSIAVRLSLDELVFIALPMTNWYKYYLFNSNLEPTEDYLWLFTILNILDRNLLRKKRGLASTALRMYYDYARSNPDDSPPKDKKNSPTPLWSINRNRTATVSVQKSVPVTKADAARRLFDIDGTGISWAVLDSGINALHPAFRKTDKNTGLPYTEPMGSQTDPLSNHTRIAATYDFTIFRKVLNDAFMASIITFGNADQIVRHSGNRDDQSLTPAQIAAYLQEIDGNLKNGRVLDWSIIAPLLRIPHNDQDYYAPRHPHGTHVAGIIGASLPELGLLGMCPGIELYDIRVMDSSGKGEEFNILAALQFIRWLNVQKDSKAVHGVNMSISMAHAVASYACGQTPVCVAAERLVSDGTVVVAAAGNLGQSMFQSKEGISSEGFRMVNITDPGNAEKVITVGATHRNQPHAYGVSYFSSKGPTGDGRIKPDLVAPGEKIESASLNDEIKRMDGTSMAAPHVSGAAALLLAKHRELIGKPERIKQILCSTATDLGRERYFQGCGMLDVLRAIQSV